MSLDWTYPIGYPLTAHVIRLPRCIPGCSQSISPLEKSTDLCGEHSPRTAIRTTVLIRWHRPIRTNYNYADIFSPTEPKTTLSAVYIHVGLVVVLDPTEQHQQNRAKAGHRQTFTKWFNCYASQCDITSIISKELDTVNSYLHNCQKPFVRVQNLYISSKNIKKCL